MRKLSTRRRHRFAGLAVLLFGLIVVGGLYATLAPKSAVAEEASARDLASRKAAATKVDFFTLVRGS